MTMVNKERQDESPVRPTILWELSDPMWKSEQAVCYPRIGKDPEGLLSDSSYPDEVLCRQCGAVPGYTQEGCPIVYLPSQIYLGLQEAVKAEVLSRLTR